MRSAHRTDLCFSICRFSQVVFIPREQPHAQWDVFTTFRAKLPAGRTDWRAFQLAFILYGGRRRRKFGGPLWKEKRALPSLGSSLGALQKRIHVNWSWSPQEQRVLKNIYGLTLEARQACRGQSKQCRSVSFHHPPAGASLQKHAMADRHSAYKHPHIK